MSDKLAWVCLFHGGKFVRRPKLGYVGGKMDLVQVNINSMNYESFIGDIENGVNSKFEHLYFKLPGKSIEDDGLRYIWDDNDLFDIILSFLHGGLIEVYGENLGVDEAGNDDAQGVGTSVREGASQGIGEGARDNASSGKEVVVENEIDLDHDDFVDEGDYIGIEDDELTVDNDDDDETNLADVRILDDDDEELLEARKNIREFRSKTTKYLNTGEPSTALLSPEQSIVGMGNVVDFEIGYQIEYYETEGDESLGSDFGPEDNDSTRLNSKFPRYDPDCAMPVFIVSMKFDSSKQFKDARIKYSVAEHREIKFIKNEKKMCQSKMR